MTKSYDKEIVVNLGNYESLKLRVSGFDSFVDADSELDRELSRLGLKFKAVLPTKE